MNIHVLVADPQAMALIKQASLSAAVFAPGWVYETQQKSNFFDNQDKYVSFFTAFIHSTLGLSVHIQVN
jgi:hypothetical protein